MKTLIKKASTILNENVCKLLQHKPHKAGEAHFLQEDRKFHVHLKCDYLSPIKKAAVCLPKMFPDCK